MATIGVWFLSRQTKRANYNATIRNNGFDPSPEDSLDVDLWTRAETPGVDPPSWSWNHWWMTQEEWDAQLIELSRIPGGNINNGNGGTAMAFFLSTDVERWTNSSVLLDMTRKPVQLQVQPGAIP